MSDDEPSTVTVKPDAAIGIALKILLLVLVFIFPFIVVYLFQGYMIDLWGEPSPTSPFYLMLFGVSIIWFIVGYALVIPRAKRLIDTHYGSKMQSYD